MTIAGLLAGMAVWLASILLPLLLVFKEVHIPFFSHLRVPGDNNWHPLAVPRWP
jgi:hypothetical protein